MAEQLRSADQMAKTIMDTPGVLAQLQVNPAQTLNALAAQAKEQVPRVLEHDRYVYRVVVSSPGAVAVLVVLGAILLAYNSSGTIQIPDILTALGSASIGALAGLLAPSPAQHGN